MNRLETLTRSAVLALALALTACETTAPNQAPTAGQIPRQTVHVGERATLELSGYFTDPDGDPLTFSAETGQPYLMTVSVSGSVLTLTALLQGGGRVTVTATEAEGLWASSSAEVTVPNRAPAWTGVDLPDRRLRGDGDTVSVAVSGFFDDPDGDSLTFSASADPSIVLVAVAGDVLTLTSGPDGGAGWLTVTATDPGGLEAFAGFGVTVNRAPVLAEIPGRTVGDSALVLDLRGYASDPDGDALTFEASSSDPKVVAAAVSGSALTLTALRRGVATVTVTATDPDGQTATSSFEVVAVPNRAPAAARIPPQTVHVGERATVELSAYFTDPDGDALTFEAVSGQPDLVTARVSGSVLTLAALGQGAAAVTVTATDAGGLSASASFEVTVPNRPPVVAVEIPPQTLMAEGPPLVVDADLSEVFTDPDGDPLTFGAGSGNSTVVRVTLEGGRPVLDAAGFVAAETEVHVVATDPDGLQATATFGVTVTPNPDRAVLKAIARQMQPNNGSWWGSAQDEPIRIWYGVEVNEAGRVVCLGERGCDGGSLTLYAPGLPDFFPPAEVGSLTELERLDLAIQGTALTRPIPPDLGNLANLKRLYLRSPYFFGSIPPELGNLVNLEALYIVGGHYPLAPQEGFPAVSLSGQIPPEFGNLASLDTLILVGANLSGPIPPELLGLTLSDLYVGDGCRLDQGSAGCPQLLDGGVCAPSDAVVEWVAGFDRYRLLPPVRRCGPGQAGLMQAVPSVPLIAGEPALLRVLDVAPPVRARFYLDGRTVHVAEVPRIMFHGAGALADGADVLGAATIPGSVVQPGLEMVVDGEGWRIPASGRQALDVREMPVFDLTLVPFLLETDPDSSIIRTVQDMADEPGGPEGLLTMTRYLLPVGADRITAHEPVTIDTASGYQVLYATGALRNLEGGTGYYMGMMPRFTDVAGVASLGGRTSASIPYVDVIAHELGHNFNLSHAPCGARTHLDPDFPQPDGTIGTWGFSPYGFSHRGVVFDTHPRFLPPNRYDLMGYCSTHGKWISGYHFRRAADYRGLAAAATAREPVRALLLWGGTGSTGAPFLEPVFVVDAPPALPVRVGPWEIEGRDAGGTVLFSLPFDMTAIADAGEGAGGFSFLLPVAAGWEALARVTLSGPGGTATLDADTDRPLSIWRDSDGRVRAILRRADGAPPLGGTEGLAALVSRGIPGPEAWRRR